MTSDLIILRYGTKGARKTVQAQAKRLPNCFRVAIDELSNIYKEELEIASPEGETRKLRHSWRVRRIGAGGKARNVVINLQWYLGLVKTGRSSIPKPGAPARTRPLVFMVRGKKVFAMSVKGVKPNPFARRAQRAARRRAHGVMRKVIVRTLRQR
jgi:hypothetical protein